MWKFGFPTFSTPGATAHHGPLLPASLRQRHFPTRASAPGARRPYRPQLTQLEDRTLCSTDILTALVNPVVLPPGVIGGPYNIQFSVGGKIAPYSYSINVPLSIVPR